MPMQTLHPQSKFPGCNKALCSSPSAPVTWEEKTTESPEVYGTQLCTCNVEQWRELVWNGAEGKDWRTIHRLPLITLVYRMYTCTHTARPCMCECVCMNAYAYVNSHEQIHTYTHTYIPYIHRYTGMHTHIIHKHKSLFGIIFSIFSLWLHIVVTGAPTVSFSSPTEASVLSRRYKSWK